MSFSLSTVEFVFREKTVAQETLIFRPKAVRESQLCAAFWTFGGGDLSWAKSGDIYGGGCHVHPWYPLCVFNEIKKNWGEKMLVYVRSDSMTHFWSRFKKSLRERETLDINRCCSTDLRNAKNVSFLFFRCKNSTHFYICLFLFCFSPKKEFNFV